MMHVVPRITRRYGKVNEERKCPGRDTILNVKDERFRLGSDACVDADLATDKLRDPQSTPDTRSPPSMLLAFYVVRGWRRREGVHDPKLFNMRVQD